MLRDSSGNGNVFSWAGYARPDARYLGLLATGKGGAAVFSGELVNAAQAHRMNAQQTFCQVWGEVARTPVGGVMFQVAAVGSEDGVHLVRAEGGFKLRTVHGAATVLSPDTLVYSGGHFKPILNVGTTEIVLRDRVTGATIRLNRPAWADAAVRTTVGALRSAGGTLSSVTRAHLYADTMHPYSLTPLQERRNIDALTPYVPAEDGDEWPDNAVILSRFNDESSVTAKLKNTAAPALNLALAPVGTVTYPVGAVATPGSGPNYFDTGAVFSRAEVVTVIYTALDFTASGSYDANVGVTGAVTNAGIEVSKASPARPLLRHQNGVDADGFATWSNRTLDKTPMTSKMLFALEVGINGKTSKLRSLDTNQAGSLSALALSTDSTPGNLRVTLGAFRRANGSVQEVVKTTTDDFIVCVGAVTEEALGAAKRLLNV